MQRIIKPCSAQYRAAALDLIERVFTEHENAREGKLVRRLAEEIRSKKYYVPELELIMTTQADEVIGCAMFSRFHLEGRYSDELRKARRLAALFSIPFQKPFQIRRLFRRRDTANIPHEIKVLSAVPELSGSALKDLCGGYGSCPADNPR